MMGVMIKRCKAFLIAAALLMIAGAVAADTPASANLPSFDSIELPFTTPGYLIPIVHYKINETTDVSLAIDTGTTANLITASTAKKLGLTPKPYLVDGKPYLLGGKPTSYVQVASLSAGLYSYPNFGFLVVDDKSLTDADGKLFADGVIGLGMISANALYIDYGQRKIAFIDSQLLTKEEIAELGFQTDKKVIPLTLSDDIALYYIPVELRNGRYSATEDLNIDTGSGITSISRKVSDELHLKPNEGGEQQTPFDGNLSVDFVIVPSITVGPLEADNANIERMNAVVEHDPPGIGNDILSNSLVLIDFPAKKMYLTALPPSTKP